MKIKLSKNCVLNTLKGSFKRKGLRENKELREQREKERKENKNKEKKGLFAGILVAQS